MCCGRLALRVCALVSISRWSVNHQRRESPNGKKKEKKKKDSRRVLSLLDFLRRRKCNRMGKTCRQWWSLSVTILGCYAFMDSIKRKNTTKSEKKNHQKKPQDDLPIFKIPNIRRYINWASCIR